MSDETSLLPDDYSRPLAAQTEGLTECVAGENVGKDCASGSSTGPKGK